MKTIYELSLSNKTIFFGIPNTEEELEKMFLLRKEIYKRNGYINAESDRDEYDKNRKCVYFIAKIDNDIIGTVRLILDNPLPTQKECFDFQEPKEMEEIPKDKRGELSRLISIPYKKDTYLPRHLVLIFLISCVFKYSGENDIMGGYSFITTKLYDKMKRIRIPFHIIGKFHQKYSINGLMYPYFSKKDNPILPIYYKLGEIRVYLENLFKNNRMFGRIGNSKFELKNNLYNRFLRLLKII